MNYNNRGGKCRQKSGPPRLGGVKRAKSKKKTFTTGDHTLPQPIQKLQSKKFTGPAIRSKGNRTGRCWPFSGWPLSGCLGLRSTVFAGRGFERE